MSALTVPPKPQPRGKFHLKALLVALQVPVPANRTLLPATMPTVMGLISSINGPMSLSPCPGRMACGLGAAIITRLISRVKKKQVNSIVIRVRLDPLVARRYSNKIVS